MRAIATFLAAQAWRVVVVAILVAGLVTALLVYLAKPTESEPVEKPEPVLDYEVRMSAGDTLTIHDPNPPSIVQFAFSGRCPNGGAIDIDRDSHFRRSTANLGTIATNHTIGLGSWSYRLRCIGTDEVAATGRVRVVRDDAHRKLPVLTPQNTIEADGRNWNISYQDQIPNLLVQSRTQGSTFELHLENQGFEQTFAANHANVMVPGANLTETTYSYWFVIDGVPQPTISKLRIQFDQTAPQVYIEAPASGTPWTAELDVRGAVLPGWTVSLAGIPIPMSNGQFMARVPRPAGDTFVIVLSHPQRGLHYYVRRER